ncbi:MAG: AI-2E family transporter [Peptostreptococcaceae bacterium]
MKIDWNQKYTTISVYSFLVICASIIFFSILDKMDAFMGQVSMITGTLQPFVIGFIIAYLLNFILVFVEEKLLVFDKVKNISKKGKRAIGIIITYIIAGIMMYLFIRFVVPQLVDSIMGLANNIPQYIENATALVEGLTKNLDANPEYMDVAMQKWNEIVNYTINIITNLLPVLGNAVTGIVSSLWNIILGIIISIYMLIDKEKFGALSKKIIYGVFNKQNAQTILELATRSNNIFSKFLSGKILDSAIIAVITAVLLSIFKMPYVLLVSVIIGITNIIPFFGPFIGAIPAFIIILFVSPVKALWFLVLIFLIQQLDGNIIGPKILGDSIGVSAFWILFSLLVAGKVLGLVGMIIGVPLFAITYSIIKDIIEAKLNKKGLPTKTEDYK